jgi:hypothetical protein
MIKFILFKHHNGGARLEVPETKFLFSGKKEGLFKRRNAGFS